MAMVRFRSVSQQLQYKNSAFIKDLNPQFQINQGFKLVLIQILYEGAVLIAATTELTESGPQPFHFILELQPVSFQIEIKQNFNEFHISSSFLTQMLKKGASYSFSFFFLYRETSFEKRMQRRQNWIGQPSVNSDASSFFLKRQFFYGSTQLTYFTISETKT